MFVVCRVQQRREEHAELLACRADRTQSEATVAQLRSQLATAQGEFARATDQVPCVVFGGA